MFPTFSGGILRGTRKERLLSKFVENECEKIDRLMELFLRWVHLHFYSVGIPTVQRWSPLFISFDEWDSGMIKLLFYFYRYSDRVKVEMERLNQIELEDLEVSYDIYFFSLLQFRN